MKYSFWYMIKCYSKFGNGELLEYLKWDDLTFEMMTKWKWYFEYRAALLKVKYPKSYIEIQQDKKEINESSSSQLQGYRRKKEITELKRKISLYKGAVIKYEKEQEMKLIKDYYNQKYINTIEKIKELERELILIKDK